MLRENIVVFCNMVLGSGKKDCAEKSIVDWLRRA